MRVLSSVTDPRMGGPQRRSLDVAKRLRDRNVETIFLIPEGNDVFANEARNIGFETHRINLPRIRPPTKIRENLRFIGNFQSSVRAIRDIFRLTDLDIVHANMAVNFQTARAAARSDVPLAWHFNDTLTPTPVKQIAARAASRYAEQIVVAADAVKDYYFHQSIDTETIYAPVDLDKFEPSRVTIDKPKLRHELGIPQNIPVVGSIGNINPIKGHEYLLRAISRLREKGTLVAVPIVGKKLDSRKSYFHKLRDLRDELGLEELVQFVGYREDVPELLSLFDLFILPSIAEACPIVVLEAMAMECPVVATSVGGVPEQIPNGEFGWLVPKKNDQALATAIEQALKHPMERRHRSENAKKRVAEVFSLTACVNRHEDLYRSLIQQ